MANGQLEPCPDCGGQGSVPVGEYHVTRQMAMDAQNPELEGMPCGEAYDYCQRCGGEGTIELDYSEEYYCDEPQAGGPNG